MTEQKKKLIPRQTALGTIRNARYGDLVMDITVFYGNFYAMPNGIVLHVPDKIYYQMLYSFLDSPEGQQYERPTEEEIKEAIRECVQMPSNPDPVYDPRPVGKQTPIEEIDEIEKNTEEKSEEVSENTAEQLDAAADEQLEEVVEKAKDDDSNSDEENIQVNEAVKDEDEVNKIVENTESEQVESFEELNESESPQEQHENEEAANNNQNESEEKEIASEKAEKDKQSTVNSESKITDNKKKVLFYVLASILGVSLVANGFLASMVMNTAPKTDVQPQTLVDYKVLTVNKDIAAGEIIAEDALTEVAITQEQIKAISGDSIITDQGKVETEFPVLSENKNNVVGMLAVDNLKKGDYLLSGDYTAIKEGVNSIAINVDGQEVLVPVEATVDGTSDVKVFAIISTKLADGTVANKAVNLGNLTFQGKALTSVFDAEGNVVEDAEPTAEPTDVPTVEPTEPAE